MKDWSKLEKCISKNLKIDNNIIKSTYDKCVDLEKKHIDILKHNKKQYVTFIKHLGFDVTVKRIVRYKFNGEAYTSNSPLYDHILYYFLEGIENQTPNSVIALPSYERTSVIGLDIDAQRYKNKNKVYFDINKFNDFVQSEPIYSEVNINKKGHFHLFYKFGKTINGKDFIINSEQEQVIKNILKKLDLPWELRTMSKVLSLPMNAKGYKPITFTDNSYIIHTDINDIMKKTIDNKNYIDINHWYNSCIAMLNTDHLIEMIENNDKSIFNKRTSKTNQIKFDIDNVYLTKNNRHYNMIKLCVWCIAHNKDKDYFYSLILERQRDSKLIKSYIKSNKLRHYTDLFYNSFLKTHSYKNKFIEKNKLDFHSNIELLTDRQISVITNYIKRKCLNILKRKKGILVEKNINTIVILCLEIIGKAMFEKLREKKQIKSFIPLTKEKRLLIEDSIQLPNLGFFRSFSKHYGIDNYNKTVCRPFTKLLKHTNFKLIYNIMNWSYSAYPGTNYARCFKVDFIMLNNIMKKLKIKQITLND